MPPIEPPSDTLSFSIPQKALGFYSEKVGSLIHHQGDPYITKVTVSELKAFFISNEALVAKDIPRTPLVIHQESLLGEYKFDLEDFKASGEPFVSMADRYQLTPNEAMALMLFANGDANYPPRFSQGGIFRGALVTLSAIPAFASRPQKWKLMGNDNTVTRLENGDLQVIVSTAIVTPATEEPLGSFEQKFIIHSESDETFRLKLTDSRFTVDQNYLESEMVPDLCNVIQTCRIIDESFFMHIIPFLHHPLVFRTFCEKLINEDTETKKQALFFLNLFHPDFRDFIRQHMDFNPEFSLALERNGPASWSDFLDLFSLFRTLSNPESAFNRSLDLVDRKASELGSRRFFKSPSAAHSAATLHDAIQNERKSFIEGKISDLEFAEKCQKHILDAKEGELGKHRGFGKIIAILSKLLKILTPPTDSIQRVMHLEQSLQQATTLHAPALNHLPANSWQLTNILRDTLQFSTTEFWQQDRHSKELREALIACQQKLATSPLMAERIEACSRLRQCIAQYQSRPLFNLFCPRRLKNHLAQIQAILGESLKTRDIIDKSFGNLPFVVEKQWLSPDHIAAKYGCTLKRYAPSPIQSTALLEIDSNPSSSASPASPPATVIVGHYASPAVNDNKLLQQPKMRIRTDTTVTREKVTTQLSILEVSSANDAPADYFSFAMKEVEKLRDLARSQGLNPDNRPIRIHGKFPEPLLAAILLYGEERGYPPCIIDAKLEYPAITARDKEKMSDFLSQSGIPLRKPLLSILPDEIKNSNNPFMMDTNPALLTRDARVKPLDSLVLDYQRNLRVLGRTSCKEDQEKSHELLFNELTASLGETQKKWLMEHYSQGPQLVAQAALAFPYTGGDATGEYSIKQPTGRNLQCELLVKDDEVFYRVRTSNSRIWDGENNECAGLLPANTEIVYRLEADGFRLQHIHTDSEYIKKVFLGTATQEDFEREVETAKKDVTAISANALLDRIESILQPVQHDPHFSPLSAILHEPKKDTEKVRLLACEFERMTGLDIPCYDFAERLEEYIQSPSLRPSLLTRSF